MEYICPMHPQIRKNEPGSCSLCGMDLEPISFSQEIHPEMRMMTLRFWISLFLSLPVILFTTLDHLHVGIAEKFLSLSLWTQLLCATVVVLWGGWTFFVRGLHSILRHSLNMFSLISLGTGIAYIFSVVVFFPV